MSETEESGAEKGRAAVAEYVLGLLGTAEHERVRRRIEAEPALQQEHDFWAARFSHLDAEFEPKTPPSYILPALERRLFGAQKSRSWWDNLFLWRSVATGALAVAAIAVGFAVLQPRPDSAALATQLVAALRAEGSDVQFVALYDGTGAVRLTALSGEAVPNSDYELWAIQGGGAPISMGVVPINARTTVELSDTVRAGWGEGSVLAITLEPQGGAPGGIPTGPVVAQGAVTQI
ncbi:MAG: anti-sigma factor [Hyphomicrobiales bacterium]|nr:MAG: anti-sigma factor [Hyphomicrobiales bacterium]